GLKAVALYRDGSKSSQPLNARGNEKKEETETEELSQEDTSSQLQEIVASGHVPSLRRRLPPKREGFTQEARIAGQKIFVRTGEYDDGSLGEVFIDMHTAGSTMRGMLDAFAVAVSLGLQHGVPLEKYVNAMSFTRFEPSGVVDHPNIKMATSVVDYVFRMIGMEYLGRKDFVQVPPADEELRYYQNKTKQPRAEMEENGEKQAVRPEIKQTDELKQINDVKRTNEGSSRIAEVNPSQASSMKAANNGAPICTECGGMTRQS